MTPASTKRRNGACLVVGGGGGGVPTPLPLQPAYLLTRTPAAV